MILIRCMLLWSLVALNEPLEASQMTKKVTVTIKKTGVRSTKTTIDVRKKGKKITALLPAAVATSDDTSAKAASHHADSGASNVSKGQKCPICGETVTKKYVKHTKNCVQRSEKEKKQKRAIFNAQLKKLCKKQKSSTDHKPITKSIISKKKGHGDIVLYSQRGRRNEEALFCSLCKKKVGTTWRYIKSNKGPVDLCVDCKTVVPKMKQKPRRAGFLKRLPGSFESGKSS